MQPPISPELLESPTTDGTPAGAFASHKARTNRIVNYFALNHPLDSVYGAATPHNVLVLLAHLHSAMIDPAFPTGVLPERERSITAAPKALERLTFPSGGGVGTNKDYDMVLKGLMTIRCRYPGILGATAHHITTHLVPAIVAGPHDPGVETVWYGPLCTPETENHLLMIESSRYLVNQILHDHFIDPKYDNDTNGLTKWLLEFLQPIAKHDFLEFNSRPYAHHSLHSLFNLFEFAANPLIRTAAHILLDYTMMKVAVSSNRCRRVSPFRRHQHRINHQAGELNDLFADKCDELTDYFMVYTGFTGPGGQPARFSEPAIGNAIISGTSTYRPPPAAYIAALDGERDASLHRFYHGTRPDYECGETADGGLEIYYNSPSFLLTAGGQFLNSGYGHDEYDTFKHAWEGTARAQATTLIATKADTANFHELLRFEAYPDPLVDPYADDPEDGDTSRTHAVNIGVGRGLAAGANLRPAERKTILEHKTSAAPAMTLHKGRLFVAWKGVDNKHINVAKIQTTYQLGIDGVEGVYGTRTVNEETDTAPAIASCSAGLLLVWKGIRNDFINIARSRDDGDTFAGKTVLSDSTEHSPAVVAVGDVVLLAWAGRGNNKLNVARIVLPSGESGTFRLENKVILEEKSDAAPTLVNHLGIPFLAWKGVNNNKLNVMFSGDQGATFQGKVTFAELSRVRPTLASHEGTLFLGWTGSDNNSRLNVARVVLGESGIQGLDGKVVLADRSDVGPALASVTNDERLFLAWKGIGNDYLNLSLSRDGSFAPAGPWLFSELRNLGLFLAAYRVPVDFRNEFDAPPDNLAIVYAMEIRRNGNPVMDFATFRQRTMDRNRSLPAKFKLGARYDFHAPDDRQFTVWFQPVGWKYQARVIDAADPIRDLDTLPLVSGEYMQAPGGHDGQIVIRHYRCEQPEVVLDYRNAASPVRIENKEACPDPWIERSKALFESARRFETEGRLHDSREAVADAADLYAELADLSSRSGQALCPFVIQALADFRVDYSVAETALHRWLSEPLQSGYASVAHALLRLGKRLRAPVFLNEIVEIYERAFGVPSPRKVDDVKIDFLKASVVQAFNRRHATQVTEFTECTAN